VHNIRMNTIRAAGGCRATPANCRIEASVPWLETGEADSPIDAVAITS
jgi:hypothetical protein